jgi:hypothetical protein
VNTKPVSYTRISPWFDETLIKDLLVAADQEVVLPLHIILAGEGGEAGVDDHLSKAHK